MTKTAYFDTNVFNHLLHKEQGVTTADESALRNALSGGKISILLSLLNLEEAFGAFEKDPDEAIRKFKLISDLANRRKLLKAPEDLLRGEIKCYAMGIEANQPFFEDTVVKINWALLHNPNKENKDKFMETIRRIKEKKRNSMIGNKSLRKFLKNTISKESKPSFEEYWERYSLENAENLADEVGMLDACKERGIDGLLEIKSVRLCVGWQLSYIYSQGFEGKKPRSGDYHDQKHVVLASVADFFVTHDNGLRELVRRIPIKNFEVLSLHGLLERIR